MTKISGQIILGIIIIVLGLMFLFDLDVWGVLGRIWPLLLIGFGLYLILTRRKEENDHKRSEINIYATEQSGIPGLFGDIKVGGLSDGIGTIDKKILIGDIVIDLTNSKLLPGENIIDTSLLIGDITMILPEEYPVKVNLTACIGDLQFKGERADGFFSSIKHKDENYDRAESKLRVLGKICIGDIKIYSDSK